MAEAWLSGPIEGVDPYLLPVAHACVQAQADIEAAVDDLTHEQIWARPGRAASIGFHLMHFAGSLDRLFTYARGEALSDAQKDALKAEKEETSLDRDALAALVREADGRVATGFLGTPLVLPALADTGHLDEAYRMLLCRETPSWLYQVDHGATTVWERWDAILPDGSIHPGTMTALEGEDAGQEHHMLSFNHYAYGAVIDWVYRNVAGLAPTLDAPGYRRVIVAPRPHADIRWARASVESSFGPIRIDWRLVESGSLAIDLDLPFGVEARLDLAVGDDARVIVDGAGARPDAEVGPGRHRIEVTNPLVIGAG